MDLTIMIIVGVSVCVACVAVAITLVAARLKSGKYLKCPDCGHIFNAPVMDEKLSGFGYTVSYMGLLKCPNCNIKRLRRDYDKVEDQTNKTYSQSRNLVRAI
jgi:uncharacterized C2H2 Zn-finger protein